MVRCTAALLLLLSLPLASQSMQIQVVDPEASEDPAHAGDPRYLTVTGPAAGDPKLQNIHGKRFQIHRPGDYTLLSIPNSKKKHGSLLEVQASVKPLEIGDPCLLFIKSIRVGGAWIGGTSMMVRAEESGADFALKVSKDKKKEGAWRPFKNMTGWEEAVAEDASSGLITTVKAVIGRREGHSDDIKGPHEHRFLIRVARHGQKAKPTTIDVALPRPGLKYLTLNVEHLKALGEPNVQGLLGLDDHKSLVVRDECKDAPGQVAASELLKVSGGLSRASAHWD